MNNLERCFLISGSMITASLGIEQLGESLLTKYSLANAIYSHADKITPEIIKSANSAMSQVDISSMGVSIFCLGVAGYCLSILKSKE